MFVSVAWYIFHSKSLFLYCSALESSEHSKVLVTVDLDRRNVLDTFLKDTFINYNHIVICLKRYTALVLLSSVFSHEKNHRSRKQKRCCQKPRPSQLPASQWLQAQNVGIRWACLFPGGLPKNMPLPHLCKCLGSFACIYIVLICSDVM